MLRVIVLVVDDSLSMAEILSMSLEHVGHLTVRTVTTDFPGLLNPHDPRWDNVGLLVCDLMLPGTSGADIMTVCRTHHPGVKIFALTGVDSGTSPEIDLAHAVADRVLHKPDDIESLVSAAQQALGLGGD